MPISQIVFVQMSIPLYSIAHIDVMEEPLVLRVPPITDRYYSLQFVDAYSNNFLYVGSRTNDTTEGIYLISRPNWQKDVLPLI